jgi:hypothetical protein
MLYCSIIEQYGKQAWNGRDERSAIRILRLMDCAKRRSVERRRPRGTDVAPRSVRGAETRGRTLRGMEVNCSKFSNGWILPLIEIEARKRMVAGGAVGGKSGILEKASGKLVARGPSAKNPVNCTSDEANSPPYKQETSRDKAAAMVGVSGRMIQSAKAVLAKAPEVFELMEKGKITAMALLGEYLEAEKAAGNIAKGTRGQLRGRDVSGNSIEELPEKMPKLADRGIPLKVSMQSRRLAKVRRDNPEAFQAVKRGENCLSRV